MDADESLDDCGNDVTQFRHVISRQYAKVPRNDRHRILVLWRRRDAITSREQLYFIRLELFIGFQLVEHGDSRTKQLAPLSVDVGNLAFANDPEVHLDVERSHDLLQELRDQTLAVATASGKDRKDLLRYVSGDCVSQKALDERSHLFVVRHRRQDRR